MINMVARWAGFVFQLGWILTFVVACTTIAKSTEPLGATSFREESVQTYRLGPNDVLRMEVFGEPDLTTETEVNGQGIVKFPLLGELRIGGKTVTEAEQYLTQRLKAGYLKNPKVTVYIVQHRSIYISGEIKNPGAYPYEEGLTVHKAVTLAGGFTERAAKGSAQVLRRGEGQNEMLSLTMDDPIQPDDLVVISESFF